VKKFLKSIYISQSYRQKIQKVRSLWITVYILYHFQKIIYTVHRGL